MVELDEEGNLVENRSLATSNSGKVLAKRADYLKELAERIDAIKRETERIERESNWKR